MRELKFRAWSLERKCYVDVWEITFDDEGLPGVLSFEYNGLLYKEPAHNFIIEQDTGLKDKNGKEIREGDIVRLYEHNWWDGKIVKCHKKPRIEGNFVVFHNDDTAAFEMKNTQPYDNGIRGEEPFGFVSQEYKVIGNIHENPELLEEEE